MNLMEVKDKEGRESENPIKEIHLVSMHCRPNLKRRSIRLNMERNFICYHREKSGHQLRFRNKLKLNKQRMKELEKCKNKLKGSSNDAMNIGISNDIVYVDGRKGDGWMLVSYAYFCMCNQKGAFIEYKEQDKRVVKLIGVRHILEIKKNIVYKDN